MRAASSLLVLSTLLVGAGNAVALDVTGVWTLYPGNRAVFVQSGTTLQIQAIATTLTGTIDAAGKFQVTGNPPGCSNFVLAGRILGDTRMVGSIAGLCPTLIQAPSSAMRCECDDQNVVGGDGCDTRCQVEPCFTCSGTPSTCSPSPDGAACDDRSACTSGETCSAGVCGGGSPVTPCIDLTGQWVETETFPGFGEVFHEAVDIRQLGTTLEFGGSPSSLPLIFGTIDPGTGAMQVGEGDGEVACLSETGGAIIATGTADSASYALLGAEAFVDTHCTLLTKTIDGERCDGPCVLPTTTPAPPPPRPPARARRRARYRSSSRARSSC
jgi:cysteine-rich repeat protein